MIDDFPDPLGSDDLDLLVMMKESTIYHNESDILIIGEKDLSKEIPWDCKMMPAATFLQSQIYGDKSVGG